MHAFALDCLSDLVFSGREVRADFGAALHAKVM